MITVELNNIPEAFQTKLRLMIISALATGKKTFSEVKSITGASDGNISAQMSKLEQMRYITMTKEFVRKKPLTTYELTDTGLNSFEDYVEMLNRIIQKKPNENAAKKL